MGPFQRPVDLPERPIAIPDRPGRRRNSPEDRHRWGSTEQPVDMGAPGVEIATILPCLTRRGRSPHSATGWCHRRCFLAAAAGPAAAPPVPGGGSMTASHGGSPKARQKQRTRVHGAGVKTMRGGKADRAANIEGDAPVLSGLRDRVGDDLDIARDDQSAFEAMKVAGKAGIA